MVEITGKSWYSIINTLTFREVAILNIENYIESQYRALLSTSTLNAEFSDLYTGIGDSKMREILTTLHYNFTTLFRTMNERLPTGENTAHFWAEPSRELITVIEITLGLYNALKNTKYAFDIDNYYFEIINNCRDFLSSSGGSELPPHMNKVELYYTLPIFMPSMRVNVESPQSNLSISLKQIDVGSYANVFKYKDTFYNKFFVVKRAKKDLTPKELERFKREYEEMRDFSSPYILEVYCYNDEHNEYIMEYMDYTLDSYIAKFNSELSVSRRKGIVQQILKAFEYIHSKNRLHRDISPKNVLLKCYDDIIVVKISDFGLVKIPDSTLTTVNTEFKGYFNDPSLIVDGFDTYGILHETFALTRLVYFVMTGKTNIDKISDPKLKGFVSKGLNVDKSKRFQTVNEIIQAFRAI